MKELDNELIKLCGKLRDEEITSEELSLLEERLDRSPEDRSFYLRFMQIDSLLEKFPPIEDQQEIEESISGRKLIRLPAAKAVAFLATAAALAVACTLGFQSFFENQVAGNDEYFAQDSVGTLILAEDCEWEDRSFSEGQRLPKGTMELEGGTAVVRFDGGAEAVLTGPVGFQIDGPTAAMLLHGEVVVRAEDDAIGFILDTPSGRLVDLGTEFAVKVEGNGETELHVHEGAVALGEDFSEKPENVIGAGHAVRIHGAVSGEREDVDLSAPRFQELIDRLNPQERRDLMTAYEGFHVDPGVYLPEE
ncbi:MAG: FecR domain-containing protein, partial [Verrucomicrobiota bacterium]